MNALLTSLFISAEKYMLPCLTKQVLGFDCPGCGLQRSFMLLLKGDLIGAFQMYPAIFTLIPLALVLIGNKFFNLKYSGQLTIALSISSVALILINYIIKLLH